MVVNFKVFKKCAPNGKITIYMGKRDYVDNIASVEPIDGIVVLDDEYIREFDYNSWVFKWLYSRIIDNVVYCLFF